MSIAPEPDQARSETTTEPTAGLLSNAPAPVQCFTVPGRPIPKARPRTVSGPRGTRTTYTPGKSLDFEREVKWEAKRARISKHAGVLALTIRFFGCRGDWDNLAKSICDALNGIAYDDDRQIEEAHVFVDRHAKHSRTEIEIRTKENA